MNNPPATPEPQDALHTRLRKRASLALVAIAKSEMESIRRSASKPLPQPLFWHLATVDGCLRGHASSGDYDEADVPEILQRWAQLLNLAPDPNAMRGTTEYRGTFQGRDIAIWGVTDRAAFERSA